MLNRIIILLLITLPILVKAQKSISKIDEMLKNEEYTNAILLLNEILEHDSTNSEALKKLGDTYFAMNFRNEAISFYQKTLVFSPQNEDAKIGLAQLFILQGELEKAETILLDVLSRNRKNETVFELLGKVYLSINNLEKAKFYQNELLKINKDNIEALTTLGIIFQKEGKNILAEQNYKRVVELRPKSYNAKINLAIFYSSIGKINSAIVLLSKLLKDYPNENMAGNILGSIFLKSGQIHLAEKYFLKVIKADPANLDAYFNLTVLNLHKKDYSGALKTADKLLTINPGYPQIHIVVATTYFLMNNIEKAIDNAREEIRMYPENIDGYLYLAGMYKFNEDENKIEEIRKIITQKFGKNILNEIDIDKFTTNLINELK